jgi:hypothetical protein
MDTLYEYALDWSAGSKRRHIDGDRTFINRYIRPDEFDLLFGGKMLLTDPSGKAEFIGVWGRHAVRHFKKVLRQRGAEFVVLHVNAHDRVPKMYTQH